MGVKSKAQKVIAATLVSAMAVTFIPEILGNNVVQASTVKNDIDTIYGTWGIGSPVVPHAGDQWYGSYVWYGNSSNNGRKYRVLSPDCLNYGSASLFLDCDDTVTTRMFEAPSAQWEGSEIQSYLNGEFYDSEFTDAEKNAIMISKKSSGIYLNNTYQRYAYGKSAALNDKIFILDAGAMLNEDYGYSELSGNIYKNGNWISDSGVANHKKGGNGFWLRTSSCLYPDSCMAIVDKDGSLSYAVINSNTVCGVSPAMNIKRSNIVFATAVKGLVGANGTEYKLTVRDDKMHIAASYYDLRGIDHKTMAVGRLVEVPYTAVGGADRISVLILDRTYSGGNGNGGKMLYYRELNTNGDPGDGGTGSFTLPAELDFDGWGTDYHVYILSEKINGSHQTDYASEPVEVSMPRFYVKVDNGKADEVYPNAGDTVTITAGTAPSGMRFDHWVCPGNEIAFEDPKASKTTFTMVCGDVYVYAVFEAAQEHSEKWVKNDGYWYYYDTDGVLCRDEWCNVSGSWYYFDADGRMMTGWQKIDGVWYYLGGNGKMRTNWQLIDGEWYYLGSNGAMRTGWQTINGSVYYFKSSGVMASNEYVSGYWLNRDGSWTYEYRATWRQDSVGWWYGDASGWYAKNATYKIDDKMYDFDSSGYCTTPDGY